MILPSEIRFVEAKVKEAFYKLEIGDQSEKELFRLINQALNNLEINAFCGIQIPKRLIPKEYNVSNLWKYNLRNAWRLIYTIEGSKAVVISLILEWMNHKEYDRRFNY